jgi:hypothetical protein
VPLGGAEATLAATHEVPKDKQEVDFSFSRETPPKRVDINIDRPQRRRLLRSGPRGHSPRSRPRHPRLSFGAPEAGQEEGRGPARRCRKEKPEAGRQCPIGEPWGALARSGRERGWAPLSMIMALPEPPPPSAITRSRLRDRPPEQGPRPTPRTAGR